MHALAKHREVEEEISSSLSYAMAIVRHSKDYVIIIIAKKMICMYIEPPPLSSSLQPKFDIGKGWLMKGWEVLYDIILY